MSLAKKAVLGGMWLLAGNTSTQVMAFLINILLARLLLPEDFGSVALISAFLAILQVLGEMGISVAVVQKKDLSENTLHNAFWLTCVSTAFISTMIWSASPYLALFFKNNELANLFQLSAFSFCFRGLYAFFNCILLREMEYKKIAVINLAGVATSGVVSVFLAFQNAGAFSVVWGQIFSAAVMLSFSWTKTGYRPKLLWNFSEMRSLLSFGLWVSLNRLLNNIAGKVDSMIIGRSIGSVALGQYFLAQRLLLVLPSIVTGMLDQVLLPIYSRLQADPRRIEKGYWDSLLFSSLLTCPPICLIFLFSQELVFFLYGNKWVDIVPLMRIMTLFAFAGCFGGGIFGSVMYAKGKTRGMALVSIFRFITLPLFLLIGSRWGVVGIAWGFSFYGVVGRLFNQVILRLFVGFSLSFFFRTIAGPFFISITATISSFFILLFLFPGNVTTVQMTLVRILLGSTIWILIYALLVFIVYRKKIMVMKGTLQ